MTDVYSFKKVIGTIKGFQVGERLNSGEIPDVHVKHRQVCDLVDVAVQHDSIDGAIRINVLVDQRLLERRVRYGSCLGVYLETCEQQQDGYENLFFQTDNLLRS